MKILIEWILRAVIVMVVAYYLPGFYVESFIGALSLVLVLGLLNIVLKPILHLFSLPITILTLGLFSLVINGLILMLAIYLVPGVWAASFGIAVLASVLISLLSVLVGIFKK